VPETALITGASSGIGEEFARQLAARGHDLVLVARRSDRLKRLEGHLEVEHRVKVHVVRCDLAEKAHTVADRVAELGLEIDLLVNNAGFGTWGRFWEAEPEREAEQVRVNCEAVVILTRAFLPGMVERGRGGVITVASTAGIQPIPYEAVYAATKAFALNFSDALHTELQGTGVRCLAVNPGPVPTEWQQVAGHDDVGVVPGKIPAEQVVREALAAYYRDRRSVIPGRVIRSIIRVGQAPRALKLRILERLYRPKD
jgi:short-subunit dehydrogenase